METKNERTAHDDAALALLRRVVAGIENGDLTVERIASKDAEQLDVRVVCVAGPRAIRAALAARAAESDAARASTEEPRPPGPADVCPKCKKAGTLRDAGDLDWLCIACNASFAPFAR